MCVAHGGCWMNTAAISVTRALFPCAPVAVFPRISFSHTTVMMFPISTLSVYHLSCFSYVLLNTKTSFLSKQVVLVFLWLPLVLAVARRTFDLRWGGWYLIFQFGHIGPSALTRMERRPSALGAGVLASGPLGKSP